MRRPDPGVYLEDIEHYAAAAIRYLGGCSLAQYQADDKTRAAVERALEITGEAMRKLAEHAPEVAARIPHSREIIGFRNVLAHGYADVDDEKVYKIAADNAPALLAAVRDVLKDFPEPAGRAPRE